MKLFPCPICKGSGIAEEGETVDVGVGNVQVSADIECGYCFGEGMIGVNSETHEKIKTRALIDLFYLRFGKEDKEYSTVFR